MFRGRIIRRRRRTVKLKERRFLRIRCSWRWVKGGGIWGLEGGGGMELVEEL